MTRQEQPKVHFFYTTVPLPRAEMLHKGAWSLLADSLHTLYPERFPGRSAEDLPQIVTGVYGKPAFRDASLPEFSLSHSGSIAACAISETGPIGVDVQEMVRWNERPDMDDIMKRFFHPKEQERCLSIADPERRHIVFYRIFSCREAYVKMTGRGLSEEPSGFYTLLDEGDIPISICDGKTNQKAGSPTLVEPPEQNISKMYTFAICTSFSSRK